VIFDVAVVGSERSQPPQVDQAVISAAIDIADGVFAAAAGNNLADQLEIFILHGAPGPASSLLPSGPFLFAFSATLRALEQGSVPSHKQPAVGETNGHSLAFDAFNNLPGLTLQVHLVRPKGRCGNEPHLIAYFGTGVGLRLSLFHLLYRLRIKSAATLGKRSQTISRPSKAATQSAS
jgi:hypothetical protein